MSQSASQTIFSMRRLAQLFILVAIAILVLCITRTEEKDYKKEHPAPGKGNLCIARFESTTGEPLYYTCPRPNESEKKSYCCYLDKCCDYKEFQKQTEKQYTVSQYYNSLTKGAIGSALKVILWIIFIIIMLIVGCCCLTFILCRKKRLFQGGIFSAPLPTRPPGPSPYAPPSNPYMAYEWPPETGSNPNAAPPPAYPTPAYPPYPSGRAGAPMTQPPFNPNYQ